LILHVVPPEEEALRRLEALFVKGKGAASQHVKLAVHDSFKRLLALSMETEVRLLTKKRADEAAINVFAEGVEKIEDVKPGMRLPGVVTNVTAFGAFVDIGVHQDGLVHISQLANRFVKNPNEVVKVHQKVMVTVLEVDLARKRIALSMKGNEG
jgi:transcriptional accessory protein Tex/SPT6